ncbi:MAG: heavy-metal-associated domain-containing protein [Verrucomicrobia bacterium]|nr:heavy-metal-associated domain-containing protein [Verrucomicrobiota bacterium]
MAGLLGWASAYAEETKDITLKVSGMTCQMCAKKVEQALTQVKGVKTAKVNLDKKQAVVTVDPAKAKTKQLIAAVAKAGDKPGAFTAEQVQLYKCESCGKTAEKAGSCCGAPTRAVEK